MIASDTIAAESQSHVVDQSQLTETIIKETTGPTVCIAELATDEAVSPTTQTHRPGGKTAESCFS